jgi:hypothetical protein
MVLNIAIGATAAGVQEYVKFREEFQFKTEPSDPDGLLLNFWSTDLIPSDNPARIICRVIARWLLFITERQLISTSIHNI